MYVYNNSIDFGRRASVPFLNFPYGPIVPCGCIAYSTEMRFVNCTCATSITREELSMKTSISTDYFFIHCYGADNQTHTIDTFGNTHI